MLCKMALKFEYRRQVITVKSTVFDQIFEEENMHALTISQDYSAKKLYHNLLL